ncbi:phosphoribosyl-ATP pyrophosphohydrolase [Thermanaerovibrio velox DSM 12556]|uniref:Histidine biosynthesis bifunctional protein HisIE n=1 Tax=Thermanaerovibrio velox DSM 12556 TaxID=926567 RepID=H0UQ55_9BACT|nr:bifunctional phosphoribosyl-AMP cyclohydrolase/phosphoribosyl-ATP diphosphatase HisIE [Thermanaerovibrio velox]EHM10693.1 phosphoribosyl-ATP pyrophosphohydrolase [Thermanaerovibrio velox DSM 12556]
MSNYNANLKFDTRGLIPVAVQSAVNGRLLMLAYANQEALERTFETGEAWFYSRSRGELWHKGSTSGNVMKVLEVRGDCDGDAVLYLVEEAGPACHTGERSCFHRVLFGQGGEDCLFLHSLEEVIAARSAGEDERSYTKRLLREGPQRAAQKVGEEAVETAIALAVGDMEGAAEEAADLLYHLLAALKSREIPLNRVLKRLAERHRAPGKTAGADPN